MWTWLRRTLASLRRMVKRGRDERRTVEARERFWAEVREGEREAETRSRP